LKTTTKSKIRRYRSVRKRLCCPCGKNFRKRDSRLAAGSSVARTLVKAVSLNRFADPACDALGISVAQGGAKIGGSGGVTSSRAAPQPRAATAGRHSFLHRRDSVCTEFLKRAFAMAMMFESFSMFLLNTSTGEGELT
jgi:hypothetical protein